MQAQAVQALQNIKLDGSALYSPSQHAIAGQAAVGLAQMTEQASHALNPSGYTLAFVSNLNHFAQKAETTRRILERYLIGTEINRVDPVYTPFTPQSVTEYPFPANDASVVKAEHLPYDINSPATNIGAYRGMLNQKVAQSALGATICGFIKPRPGRSINSFI